MKYPYFYSWKNNSKRETLYRRRFRVVHRFLAGNSALVEFESGQREVISRNAMRKVKSQLPSAKAGGLLAQFLMKTLKIGRLNSRPIFGVHTHNTDEPTWVVRKKH